MKQVAISLEPEVANAFYRANALKRKKAENFINFWLKSFFINKKSAKEELFKTMDRASAIAHANGLTPEILERLLNEQD